MITVDKLKSIKTNDVFVETGSGNGGGIRTALDAGYSEVLSIECHEGYYTKCKAMFEGEPRVKQYFGDSSKDLYSMIESYDKPLTFWLDAHYSWNDPSQDITKHPGNGYVPLIDELTQIKNHPIKNHIIMIDDISQLNDLQPRGDKPPTGTLQTQMDNLIKFILTINPEYKFEHMPQYDILIAIV